MKQLVVLSVVITSVCLCVLSVDVSGTAASELVLLHFLFRHGDRSPAAAYPKDPYQESAWPQGFGQLSTVGMKQHYALGQFIRRRYIEGHPHSLLNKTYDRYQIQVNSTDFDRTLMSAYCNLAGLFPPQDSQVWNDKLLWQPIPVHTRPLDDDHVLNMDAVCPKYTEELNNIYDSDPVRKMELRNKEFYKFIDKMTGSKDFGIRDLFDVADTVYCEKVHNMSLPSWLNTMWVNQTAFEKLRKLEDISYTLEFNQPVLRRLRGGSLLGEIVKNMKDKRDGTLDTRQKVLMYSAHDSTVAALLSAMKVFNDVAPPYTATVFVELHNSSHGELTVEVYYKNVTTSDVNTMQLHQLTLPNCTASCPLDEFIKLTQADIPSDWHVECQLASPSTTDKTWFSLNVFLLVSSSVVGLVVIIVVIVGIVMLLKNRRSEHHYRPLEIT